MGLEEPAEEDVREEVLGPRVASGHRILAFAKVEVAENEDLIGGVGLQLP